MTGEGEQAAGRDATDWEHLLFLAAIAGFVVWYLWDAAAASPTFSNLVLIGPAGALALILVLFIGAGEVIASRGAGSDDAATAAAPEPAGTAAEGSASRYRVGATGTILLLMAAFAAFVAAIPYAGLDVASFCFVAGTLWLLGERRLVFIVGLAFGIAAGISAIALALLAVPMPMGVAQHVGVAQPMAIIRQLWGVL